ncbi:alpha/beta-hydrolase [Pleomassaria siparia CBS 279.74]|uniref:Alpha/beta-hydrolase n=1 Tax=Pleomassaria siparia CBS 279.74 TaxID=1314801 RepID=A0A6G1K9Z2_9PLEO|nr:alpha/beta-hydrolase [Pleomassaria siparia CBS 279.74]
MEHHGILKEVYIKIRVTLTRLLIRVVMPLTFRNDRALVKTMGVRKERIYLPSRDAGRTVKADLYHPLNPHPSGPAPVLVNWHGSGHFIHLFESDTLFCARIAERAGVYVLDADYRKAPECRFPRQLDDIEDALLWVASQPQRFDASRVMVSGFSAGGNLALVAATAFRKKLQSVIKIMAVVAFYPLTDHSIDPEDKVAPKPKRAFSVTMLRFMSENYVPDKRLRTDPKVSPGRADASEFPPTVVMVTCEGDNLGPEGVALGERLKNAGGERKVISWQGKDLHHAFDKGCKEGSHDWEQREVAYGLCEEAVKEVCKL